MSWGTDLQPARSMMTGSISASLETHAPAIRYANIITTLTDVCRRKSRQVKCSGLPTAEFLTFSLHL